MDTLELRERNQTKKDNLIKTVLGYLKDPSFKTVYINIYYEKPIEVVRINKITSKVDPHIGIISHEENIHESHKMLNMNTVEGIARQLNIMERVVQVLNIITNSNLDLFKISLKYIVEINTISIINEYKEFYLEC